MLGGRNTRTVEHLAQRALLSGGWLLGPLKQQVAVSVAVLARAMWRDALAGGEPVTVLSNRQIIALGGQ